MGKKEMVRIWRGDGDERSKGGKAEWKLNRWRLEGEGK